MHSKYLQVQTQCLGKAARAPRVRRWLQASLQQLQALFSSNMALLPLARLPGFCSMPCTFCHRNIPFYRFLHFLARPQN